MNNERLIRAVTNDTKGVLKPVLDVAYSLEPVSKYEMLSVAEEVNNRLGYTLFEDLHYPRLVRDFSLVARATQLNAIGARVEQDTGGDFRDN